MKKFSKKQLIIGASTLWVLGVIISGFVIFGDSPPKQSSAETIRKSTTTGQQKNSAHELAQAPEEQKTQTSTSTTQNTATQAPVSSQATQANTTIPAPQSAGEAGILVSDKAAAMSSAGIAQDQQAAADAVITRLSNWRYAEDGSKNLCSVTPASKMASFGADYLTNPITQLKYCNSYVNVRYQGAWANWK